MKKLLSFVCFGSLLVSCKDSPVEPLPAEVSGLEQTKKITSLEKALAVFDEPQLDEQELFLRTLDLAPLLPKLDQQQILEVYQKLSSVAVFNSDALVLMIQRLARLDTTAAKNLVSNIQGLNTREINYLNALIHYIEHEDDLARLTSYFQNELSLEDAHIGSFHGENLAWMFWYKFYKTHPTRLDEGDYLGEPFEPYTLAKIRRGEFDDLEELSKEWANELNSPSEIDEILLASSQFNDFKQAKLWYQKKKFKNERYSNTMCFADIMNKQPSHYLALTESEKDLLTISPFSNHYILLHLGDLADLSPEAYQRILNITTERYRYQDWGDLTLVASYYYAKQNALAAYKAVYDRTYSKAPYVTTFPLLELVKIHPHLASREYEKLSKWPLITPTGLFADKAADHCFSFMSQLAIQQPDLALSIGGKYFDYPKRHDVYGYSTPLTGLAYGLAKIGKEKQLVDIFLNAPDEWQASEINFDIKAEHVLEGLALHSLQTWKTYHRLIAKKYNLDEEELQWTAVQGNPTEVIAHLKSLPPSERNTDLIQAYFEFLNETNPILALCLADKHGLTIKGYGTD